MERELEKTLMEIECSIKNHEQRGNTHTQSVLEQARDIIAMCAQAARTPSELKEIIRTHMNDGWIPVEERLPEAEQEHVLACRRDGSIDTARYSPYSDRWYVGSMCSVSLDVIAWRPLPEPYRPERSVEK